ncbi:hypothetical protein [Georgenia sp. AZ-5]|uniref:hypothetical protein n=1 Tax=Georgenia sp. AZ-5 TaxID=3367526 RepID=UPI0037550955
MISILVFVFVVMAGMQVAEEVEAEQAAAQELLDDTLAEDEITAAPELESEPAPSTDPAEATFSDPTCEALFGEGEKSVISLMAATMEGAVMSLTEQCLAI